MQRHTKVYMAYFDYKSDEFIPCEACGKKANDIHHINGRGKGKDVIENLMALCRECHEKIHDKGVLTKSETQLIHNTFLIDYKLSFRR